MRPWNGFGPEIAPKPDVLPFRGAIIGIGPGKYRFVDLQLLICGHPNRSCWSSHKHKQIKQHKPTKHTNTHKHTQTNKNNQKNKKRKKKNKKKTKQEKNRIKKRKEERKIFRHTLHNGAIPYTNRSQGMTRKIFGDVRSRGTRGGLSRCKNSNPLATCFLSLHTQTIHTLHTLTHS